MKLNLNSSLVLVLLVFISIEAQAAGPIFTVTPVADDKIYLNRIVPDESGGYKVVESISAKVVEGPWTEQGAHVKFNANSAVAENLRSINPPKPSLLASAEKQSRLAKMSEDYDVDVRREDICGLSVDRSKCVYTDPIYSFSLKYKHSF